MMPDHCAAAMFRTIDCRAKKPLVRYLLGRMIFALRMAFRCVCRSFGGCDLIDAIENFKPKKHGKYARSSRQCCLNENTWILGLCPMRTSHYQFDLIFLQFCWSNE